MLPLPSNAASCTDPTGRQAESSTDDVGESISLLESGSRSAADSSSRRERALGIDELLTRLLVPGIDSRDADKENQEESWAWITIAGERVLAIPEISDVVPWVLGASSKVPLMESLSSFSSLRLSGCLLIQAEPRAECFAFRFLDGQLLSGRGPGLNEEFARWIDLYFERGLDRILAQEFGSETLDRRERIERLHGEFLLELFFHALDHCARAGARILVLQGKVEWKAELASQKVAPRFEHIVLEYARRSDEIPGLRRQLGVDEAIVIPLSQPGTRPKRADKNAVTKKSYRGESEKNDIEDALSGLEDGDESPSGGPGEDPLDFIDHPDESALSEWLDARRMWELCDGNRRIGDLVDHSLMGEFRGVSALLALQQAAHISVEAAPEDSGSFKVEREADERPKDRSQSTNQLQASSSESLHWTAEGVICQQAGDFESLALGETAAANIDPATAFGGRQAIEPDDSDRAESALAEVAPSSSLSQGNSDKIPAVVVNLFVGFIFVVFIAVLLISAL